MSRSLRLDLALVVVTVGGAWALTLPLGYGVAEFVFVGCLLALLAVGLRQATRAWARAIAQRRLATSLARTSPSESALRAADAESDRMSVDIGDTLRTAFDEMAVAVGRAQAVPVGDDRALAQLAAIQRQAVVATTELRRMLGLLRTPDSTVTVAPVALPGKQRRRPWQWVASGLLAVLMFAEIVMNSLTGDAEPGAALLQVVLSLVVVVVSLAKLDTTVACLYSTAAVAVGLVLGAPVFGGLWLAVVLAALAWRSIVRPSRQPWGYLTFVILCLLSGAQIWQFSRENFPIHALVVGAAIVMAVVARVGDQLRSVARASVVRSEHQLAEETERAVRERRLAVARELHDALSGTVGVIVAQAGAAEVQWASRPERAEAALQAVVNAVDNARRDLDRMAPAGAGADHLPGLQDIPELVERMRSAGVAIRLTSLPTSAPAAVGAATYRIVQECLANVARHAPGATANVTVTAADQTMQVTVVDDGPGLAGGDGGGYGLTGLRERVGLLGGTLTLDSRGSGLRVVATLPLRQEVG